MSSPEGSHGPDVWSDLFLRLQASGFSDIAGARMSATVPVSEGLVNRIVALSLPPNAPIRGVTIQPETAGRFSVRIVPKATLLPAITLRLAIEEQPRLPESAVLVLRMATLGGLFGLAGGAVSGLLPPGVMLDGDRIRVDLRALATQHRFSHLLDHVKQLQVSTDQGRLVLLVDAVIG
jgi:hypothetical protein